MMSARQRSRIWFALLLAALPFSMGLSCEDFVAAPTGTAPAINLRPEVVETYQLGSFKGVIVDLTVSTSYPIQAVEMSLLWDVPDVVHAGSIPHSAFDDDGALFDVGLLQAQALTNIVDFRHGPSTVQGEVRVASVGLIIEGGNEPVTFRMAGEVIGPDGTRYEVVISESTTLEPSP
jgi:hypothetical protein